MNKKILGLAFVLSIMIFLSACISKANKQNFDKIQPGMTFSQVIAILGQPSSTSSISLENTIGTTATWDNRNGTLTVLFFNGRVKIKQFIEGVSTPREEKW